MSMKLSESMRDMIVFVAARHAIVFLLKIPCPYGILAKY